MKINITIDPYDMGDYVNVSPLKGDDPFNLSVDQSECKEIIAEEIIDYIPTGNLVGVLQHYVDKLRMGGKLVVGGTDLIELSKDIIRQSINMHNANMEIYGKQEHSWDFKRGCVALNDVVTVLGHLGLHITKQRLDGTKFIVEAIRE